MVAQLFTGLFVPAATPQPIIEQVHEARTRRWATRAC